MEGVRHTAGIVGRVMVNPRSSDEGYVQCVQADKGWWENREAREA